MRDYLTYCPSCLANKYHSLFHQFLFIHKCPFHSLPLQNSCPKCNQKIPYELDDEYFKEPFTCKCGFEFAKVNRRINPTTIAIKDSNIIKWLNLVTDNDFQAEYIFEFMEAFGKDSFYQEDDFKYCLSDIFLMMQHNKALIFSKEKITRTRSIPQIVNLREEKLNKYDFVYKNNYLLRDLRSESYLMSNQLFKSIARHLRNTILKRHIGCIKQFTRNSDNLTIKDVCPYAIAYVIWRRRLQYFKSNNDVDNYGTTPFGRFHYTEYGYPIKYGYEILDSILRNIDREEREGRRSLFHWRLNRIIGEYILADYKRCLVSAKNFINGKGFDRKYIDSFDLLSKVITAIPQNPLNSYKLYLSSPISITELVQELQCPNNSVKKRRGPVKRYVHYDPINEILDKIDNNYSS